MKCLSPSLILIKDKVRGYHYDYLPCGKCFACLKNYQNSVMLKILYEIQSTKKPAIFFTLTYREFSTVRNGIEFASSVVWKVNTDTGECGRTVVKKHIQDWFKRFRTNYQRDFGNPPEFKYYYTSEYGPRTLRPHGHGVIIGLSVDEVRPLFEDWETRFGFTSYKVIKTSSEGKAARYVSKYCSKGQFENPLVASGVVDPTFHLQSNGFADVYINQFRDYFLCLDVPEYSKYYRNIVRSTRVAPVVDVGLPDYIVGRIVDRCFLNVKQFRYSMPRYFKSKFYYDKDYFKDSTYSSSLLQFKMSIEIRARSEDLREREFERFSSQFNGYTNSEVLRFWCDSQDHDSDFLEATSRESLAEFYDKSQL